MLSVLFFHAGLGVPGGFVGVDVFFVISGFVITRLPGADRREGRFSITPFYRRRAHCPAFRARQGDAEECRLSHFQLASARYTPAPGRVNQALAPASRRGTLHRTGNAQ